MQISHWLFILFITLVLFPFGLTKSLKRLFSLFEIYLREFLKFEVLRFLGWIRRMSFIEKILSLLWKRSHSRLLELMLMRFLCRLRCWGLNHHAFQYLRLFGCLIFSFLFLKLFIVVKFITNSKQFIIYHK